MGTGLRAPGFMFSVTPLPLWLRPGQETCMMVELAGGSCPELQGSRLSQPEPEQQAEL